MNENRLRISIIVLLMAVAVASFGCGGGSGANLATGGDLITAVVPDSGSTRGDGGNAPGSPTGSTRGDGGNAPGSPTGSTRGDGGNAPAGSTQNTQTTQLPVPESFQLVDFQEQEEDSPLPWEHGLGAGKIILRPGQSEEYGNLVATCPSGNVACIILARTDGSLIYARGGGTPSFTLIPPEGFPAIPLPLATETAQAPVVELDFGTTLHVGSNVAPRVDKLTTGVDRSGVSVSYGEVQDGIGADKVLAFMNQHVSLEEKIAHSGAGDAPGLETFPEPPTIRLVEGTSDLYARFAARAVQLINNALPYEKRITLSTERFPTDTRVSDVSEGEILLKFGSFASFALGSTRLISNNLVDPQTNEEKVQKAFKAIVNINEHEMRRALVYDPPPEPVENTVENAEIILEEYWPFKFLDSRVKNTDKLIKWYNDGIFLSVVVHELMHALGFYHTDESRNSKSIMHPIINKGQVNEYSPYLPNVAVVYLFLKITGPTDEEATDESERNVRLAADGITPKSNPDISKKGYVITGKTRGVPGHILFPLDRAALLAAYGSGRLDPGAQPEELTAENLGAWSDTSFHLRGDVDFPGGGASFGVASANGLTQPWAEGPTPWTNLADNNDLSGSATWNGALLGVTSSSETVAGAASLSVNLASLDGRIDFTGMEKWGVKEAPGAVGSGMTWGDGDLGYAIEVSGNTFIQTGGDDGQVTGAFFGAAHEAMGGVLERADLAAGFGGKR